MSTYTEYAKWGWPTFPVAGPAYASNKDDYKTWKAPLVNWGEFQKRFPTKEEIYSWEKKWPLAWIGCVTGPFSNLFVIDIDGEKGKQSLNSLSIPLPITKVSETQRGYHYFFKWSKRMDAYVTSRNGLFPGIDIKGNGGFIIVPSSSGNRKWIVDELCAELPEAWYSHLSKEESLPKNWQAKSISNLSEGNRHETFVSLISSCFNAKWPVESIMAVLRPFAVECKLDESLETLILDVQRRYFKETIVNDADTVEKRLLEMQDRTREWTAYLSSLNLKGKPDVKDTLLLMQDAYDSAAMRWVKTESIPWEESDAAKIIKDSYAIH